MSDGTKPQRRHNGPVRGVATPPPPPQGSIRPVLQTRDGDGPPPRHDAGQRKGISPLVPGPTTTPRKTRDGGKVPSKHDGEVPQLQRPPSPSEPANPVPVEAPMNRPSNNGDQLQSINDGPVPIVAALPTPDSGTPVPEFPSKIRDRGKLSSRRDLPVPTPLQQEPAIKIPDGDIPVPGRIPTPPPPPPMATFPRGALYGGNVPPKRDGLAAGLTPPPAPAREPEIPFYRFPDSGTSVPEFLAPVHGPTPGQSKDGEKLPSNADLAPMPPQQQEPAIPNIRIPTPPPPPPTKTTFPRGTLYGERRALGQTKGSTMTSAPAEPIPDKVPPPHSPPQGPPRGPPADQPST